MLNRGHSDRTPCNNQLLAALSGSDLERIEPRLQPVPLELGEVAYESRGTIGSVYFPFEGGESIVAEFAPHERSFVFVIY
jgi:hypothetical protein